VFLPVRRREHPLDHTSILNTVQQHWSLPSLTARDAAAPSFADALSLATPRTDDVLAGVTVPTSAGPSHAAAMPSHLQEVQADLISRQYPAGQHEAAGALSPSHSTSATVGLLTWGVSVRVAGACAVAGAFCQWT
jgi:hypothetical protein